MSDNLIQLLTQANRFDVLQPLVILRVCEHKHRKGGGGKPECIKLSSDFYHKFMESYRTAKQLFKGQNRHAEAEQLDMERPHLFGLPIVENPGSEDDITFYVPPNLILRPR